MKRNKLAAGALALALGLSAVAPSFAADTTSTKTEVKSTTLFQEKYAEELKKAQALYEDATAKKARLDKAEVAKAEAEDRVLAANKKYADITSRLNGDTSLEYEVEQARKALSLLTDKTPEQIKKAEKDLTYDVTTPIFTLSGNSSIGYVVRESEETKTIVKKEAAPKTFFKVTNDVNSTTEAQSVLVENPNYQKTNDGWDQYKYLAKDGKGKSFEFDDNGTTVTKWFTNDPAEAQSTIKYVSKDSTVSEQRQREFNVAYERYANAWKTWNNTISNRLSEKDAAYQELIAAERAYDVAVTEYKAAKKAADPAVVLYEEALAKLKGAAEAYNVVIVATNNGIEVKGEKEAPAKKDVDYVGLQAAIDRANETLRAVELLEKLTPNTAANNRAKLNALVAEQKATIAKAEAILKAADKKVALVATAYAAEEEVTAEDVDALIKELDDNTDAIQKELKDLDKDVKVEDEKPADDDKKDDKKPADEDKKDDDKKEDKADDKKEDKADDKKVDTTKVVNKSANKTAGSNAKTGIAGVAGVAGVLAAASVAYAASKKNN